jgi:hypothetical protein
MLHMVDLLVVIVLDSAPIMSEPIKQNLEVIQKDFDSIVYHLKDANSMISRVELMIDTPMKENAGLPSWYKDKAAGVLISPNIKKGLKTDSKFVF